MFFSVNDVCEEWNVAIAVTAIYIDFKLLLYRMLFALRPTNRYRTVSVFGKRVMFYYNWRKYNTMKKGVACSMHVENEKFIQKFRGKISFRILRSSWSSIENITETMWMHGLHWAASLQVMLSHGYLTAAGETALSNNTWMLLFDLRCWHGERK